jgi:hypothetical protein
LANSRARPDSVVLSRVIAASLITLLATVGAGCADQPPAAPDQTIISGLPAGIVISNVQSRSTTAGTKGPSESIAMATETGVAYVSMEPGTFPSVVTVDIRNRTTGGASRHIPVIDGGFDPVQIEAREGDLLAITDSTATGVRTLRTLIVPARRPPTVVRSNPAKGRVDVALNVIVSVIFSEPINPKTLSPTSLRLLHDGNPVTGSVRLSDNAWTAEFVPDNPLAAQSSYELVITQEIRDLDGDVLEHDYESDFRTGGGPAIPLNGVITGIVTERTPEGIRPLVNVRVYAWVQIGPYGYSRGDVPTDANGRYRMDLLPPGSTVILYPYTSASYPAKYDQPCASIVELADPSVAMDIELVPEDHPLPETATSLPLITGIVYELNGDVRQPVAGAHLSFDTQGHSENDFPSLATTTTDVSGRYAFCRMPSSGNLHVTKDGYVLQTHEVSVKGSTQLDVELKKL